MMRRCWKMLALLWTLSYRYHTIMSFKLTVRLLNTNTAIFRVIVAKR